MTKRRAKGEGSLYFNSNSDRWVAQITLPSGKRKSKSAKSQKVIRDWLIKERNKLREDIFVIEDNIKLGDYLDRYMSDVAVHNLRPKTFATNSSHIRIHIKPELGNIKLTALRPKQVQDFYTKKLNQGLSLSTVNACHNILHKCLKQALKWGLLSRNVTDLVEVPKRRKTTPNTWTAEQVNCFLEAVSDHRWYPIYVLAVYCGMRQGEILGLHLEDIDFQKGFIHIKHQLTYVNGQGFSITEPKTEKSKRLVTVPSTALNALKEHCKYLNPGQKLVFTTSTGNPISNRNVTRHFKAVIQNIGLPEIRFHDLRHTHATLLLVAGVHPKVVQERLGHSQISMTLDTYSHVIPSLQIEASEKFESILS